MALVVVELPVMVRLPSMVEDAVEMKPARVASPVLRVLAPISMLPKPEFIDPEFSTPVVTKEVSPGYPVVFVRTPEAGVPRAGVTRAGDVAKTSAPDPVSQVTAVAKLADDGVPSQSATPEPKDIIPVPPLETARVPVVSERAMFKEDVAMSFQAEPFQ